MVINKLYYTLKCLVVWPMHLHQTKEELDKSKRYVFIGYDDNIEAFRLVDSIDNKVIVS